MTEAQLQDAIRDLAKLRGWYLFHPYDSRRSTPGFPDLVMVHPRTGQLLVVELKSARGRLTADQCRWLTAFAAAGVYAACWRPDDLTNGTIARALTPSDVGSAPQETAHVSR